MVEDVTRSHPLNRLKIRSRVCMAAFAALTVLLFLTIDIAVLPQRLGDLAWAHRVWGGRTISWQQTVGYWRTADAEPKSGEEGFAFYRWPGSISRHVFEKGHSAGLVSFKVLAGKLYVKKSGPGWDSLLSKPWLDIRYRTLVEMLLLTIHFFRIGDVDFNMSFEDSVPCDEASMTYSVHLECERGGFAVPSFSAYTDSKSPEEFNATFKRLDALYPKDSRIPKAVWRGSTTGLGDINTRTYMSATRVKISFLGRFLADLLDVGLSSYVQLSKTDADVQNVLERDVPLHPEIKIEDFNKYMAIIDVDGNAWSDRFGHLASFNTPILKQYSKRHREYFGHLLRNGTHVLFFRDDLTDFIPIVRAALSECQKTPFACEQRVQNLQAFAREHLSHMGVLRATAFALDEYTKKIEWTPTFEESYSEIPRSECCKLNPSLPKDVIREVVSGSGIPQS